MKKKLIVFFGVLVLVIVSVCFFKVKFNTYSNVKIGDYVRYVPNNISYKVEKERSGNEEDQFYNPSLTTDWRVMDIKGNKIILISDDRVLTNTGKGVILRGKEGYVNGVEILNNISDAFVNPQYAKSGRSLGSSKKSKGKIDIIKNPIGYDIDNSFPYSDKTYKEDVSKLNEAGLLDTSGMVWLASRMVNIQRWNIQYTNFGMRNMDNSGEIGGGQNGLYHIKESGITDNGFFEAGIRPIVELLPNIEFKSGNGTIEEPWIVNEAVSSTDNINKNTEIKIGDYVTYVPEKNRYVIEGGDTGVGKQQVFHPKTTNSWKVWSVNGNEIELISSESIGDLSLQGEEGYINSIKILNQLCRAYINPQYAIEGRALGSSFDSCEVINSPLQFDTEIKETYKDEKHQRDIDKINSTDLFHHKGRVWLASRDCEQSYTKDGNKKIIDSTSFMQKTIVTDGFNEKIYFSLDGGGYTSGWTQPGISSFNLCEKQNNLFDKINGYTFGVRAIIKLKSEVKVIGGQGTSASPWQISI